MTTSSIGNIKSFICERTAEYVLVPALKNILRRKFNVVVPMFPWATREGGNLSNQIHNNDRFRVVGLYARRPKLISPNDSNIIIKINRSILIGADYSSQRGIPIIAGCPLARNFWELGNCPNNAWIKLEQESQDDFEIYCGNIQQFMPEWIYPNEEQLLNYLMKMAILVDLKTALELFKNTKRICREAGFSGYLGMGGYKPVYFLLK